MLSPFNFVRLIMASIAELTQQVVVLTDQVQTLNDRLIVAEQKATAMQTQGGMGRGSDSGIFDKKRLYPKELRDSTSFRSWSERFIAWITMDNPDVGQTFQRAGRQDDPLDVQSLSVQQVACSKAIYAHLRALTENFKKAAKVVRLVKADNGLEAWRRLVKKFDPQNAEVHAAHLEAIVTFGTRDCVKSVGDVPTVLDRFQRLLDDYEEVTNDTGSTTSLRRRSSCICCPSHFAWPRVTR